MKCIKHNKTGEIRRVADDLAYQLETKGWSYIPKSEWKAATRVAVEESSKPAIEKKSKKSSTKVGKVKELS